MGLIKTAGVLITQNRFSKDDNGIYGGWEGSSGKMFVEQGQATRTLLEAKR
jgi:N-methylhydantoinase B/oxoprolinase/acetone carboxylase alpha subunit